MAATSNMAAFQSAPDGIKTYHTKPYPRIDVTRPELSTAGKVLLITGGGSGLGLAITEHFAKSGCTTIAITGRRHQVLEEAKQKIEASYPGTKVLTLPGDVADGAAVKAAFNKTKDTYGPIDILVGNAAILGEYEPLGKEASADEWWSSFEINVKGSHNILTAFHQTAAQDATIIHITSGGVNTLMPYSSAYSSTKVACTRLFEIFQLENQNFRVVNVAPGCIDTPMLESTQIFLKNAGYPRLPVDEIELPASYAVWACSPEAAFVKGKFVWCHWDVDELKQLIAEKAEDKAFLHLAVHGVPNMTAHYP